MNTYTPKPYWNSYIKEISCLDNTLQHKAEGSLNDKSIPKTAEKVAPVISTYIQSLYDTKDYSDFKLYEAEGSFYDENVIYLHKMILVSNPYFKSFFESAVCADKSKMQVESIVAANDLASYIYGSEFNIDLHIEPNQFLALVRLTEQWLMPKEILAAEFHYLYGNWKSFLETDISLADQLYLHFNNHPESNIIGMIPWSGKILAEKILLYLSTLSLPKSALDWHLFNLLSEECQLRTIISYNAFEKLNNFSGNLSKLPKLITDFYKQENGFFSAEQLCVLKIANYITKNKSTDLVDKIPIEASMALVVESFVPFKAILYRSVSLVHGKSEKLHSIIITPKIKINRTDKLYFGEACHQIKSIYWNTTDVEHALPGNSYHIGFDEKTELPDNSTIVYKVEEIN